MCSLNLMFMLVPMMALKAALASNALKDPVDNHIPFESNARSRLKSLRGIPACLDYDPDEDYIPGFDDFGELGCVDGLDDREFTAKSETTMAEVLPVQVDDVLAGEKRFALAFILVVLVSLAVQVLIKGFL
jgi:hypothetical protein